MLVFISGEFRITSPACRDNSPQIADRQFQFEKPSQLFIGVHNEPVFRRRGVRQ
jgi:hypothetical protein